MEKHCHGSPGSLRCGLLTADFFSLAGRVGRTYVHVAQVAQSGFVFVAQSAGEIRIVEPLIPR